MLTKFDGSPLDPHPQAVKVRLSQVFRLPGQTMGGIVEELKSLTEADLEDFRRWFESAGFPCTHVAAAA